MNGVRCAGVAELFANFGAAQDARNPGQSAQVFGSPPGWGQQGEDDVHGRLVHSPVVHRRFQAHENTTDPLKPWNLGMRHGDAVTDPGGGG